MTKKFDQWDRLQAPGQHVVIPGVRPMQVSKLAKANVRRRLGPRAVVVTAYISEIDSTFVALAYVPSDLGPSPKTPPAPPKYTGPEELSDEDRSRMMAVATSKVREPSEIVEEPDDWDKLDGND